MYNGRHISFNRVLLRAMRHPNASDLTQEQAAEYSFELIRRLGIPLSFSEKTRFIKIRNYKALLPEDIIYLRGIRYSIKEETSGALNWMPVRYTGDIYQSSFHCPDYSTEYEDCRNDITSGSRVC